MKRTFYNGKLYQFFFFDDAAIQTYNIKNDDFGFYIENGVDYFPTPNDAIIIKNYIRKNTYVLKGKNYFSINESEFDGEI